MAFRNDLDALILSVLQSEALHGYEIAKRIHAKDETAFRNKEGQLYPILHRLENDRKIQGDWVSRDGLPAHKVYLVAERGDGDLIEMWRRISRAARSLRDSTRPKSAVMSRPTRGSEVFTRRSPEVSIG